MLVCLLQDLAVEAAFPQSGISRVSDCWVKDTRKMLSRLRHGRLYSGGYGDLLLSGSRPEGLAMEDNWGHDQADWDYMWLYGGPFGVNVMDRQQQEPRGESSLEFRPEGCPVAYTKLQVTNLPALRKDYHSHRWIEGSVHRSGNHCWLDTNQAVRGIRYVGGPIAGPAAQLGTRDYVPTLVSNRPHPDMQLEFSNRPRQWPPVSLITNLLELPMLLVLVGHKLSPDFNLLARTSWSHLEFELIQELSESVRQGYIACKYVVKHFLKAHRGQSEAVDGRSRVCSYHIKTVFLRYLEKTHSTMITSPFRLFLDLLHDLDECLKVGKLPHYFLPQCDLLETVKNDDLHVARQVIADILSDPLDALLTSPTDPVQIYGEVHPDDLVVTFRRVSSHPTCVQSWKNLSELLARVHERRQQRYTEQLQSDEKNETSGRTALIGLVETLKQIKHA